MKKNILNEELGRIKSLMGESKSNSNVEINEDILSLYRKFDITLNERTIEVLSNGMINEQGIGEKISTAFKNIGLKFRNMMQNSWAKKQGLPTPKQLMENDQKKSPAVVNHSAYKDTITLMYRKKIRNENAILYWYYGEGYTGGKESPEDRKSAEKLITIMKQLEAFGTYDSDGFKNFVKELEELFAQGIYVSLDVMGDTIGDESTLSSLLKSQNQVAFVDVNPSYDQTNYIKLTPSVIKQYNLNRNIQQGKGKNSYYITHINGHRFDVIYKEDKGTITKQDAEYATGLDENIFNSLAFELKNLAAEGGVAVGLEFTDQDKISILDYVQLTASQEGYSILDATSFDLQTENVGVDKSGIIEDLKTIKEGETIGFVFQYPDKNDSNALKNSIYNKDDGKEIPTEGIERIKGAVQDAINSVKSNGFTIVKFGRYAGATTSRVGTKYGSEDGTSSEENNVTLATDRCGAINAVVDKIVSDLLPGVEVETSENIINANQGPGWYSSKGGEVTGSLYRQWSSSLSILLNALEVAGGVDFTNKYRTDSPFAPINFYVYRLSSTYKNCPWSKEGLKKIISTYKSYGKNASAAKVVIDAAQKALLNYQYPTQQQVQDEYESVYSRYRGSWVSFGILGYKETTTPPEQVKIKDIEVSAHGDWVCSITFPDETEPDKEKKKIQFRLPDIDIKWPKLKIKKIFKFSGGGGIPFISTVKTFCEDAYQGADMFD
jgi:hypothetical protein